MVTVVDHLLLRIDVATAKANEGIKALEGLLMSLGFSLLFTGMAINAYLSKILNSLFTNFLTIEGEGGVVTNMINNLRAKFGFLKFDLIDTFAETGAIDVWVDRVDDLMDSFIELDDESKSSIVDMAIDLFLATAAAMALGMAFLFILGPLALVKAALGVSLLNPITLIFIVVLGIIVAFIKLMDITGGWDNAIKALAFTIKFVLLAAVHLVVLAIVTMINTILVGINWLIYAYNLLASTQFGRDRNMTRIDQVALVESPDLIGNALKERDAMKAQFDEDVAARKEAGKGNTIINIAGSILGENELGQLLDNYMRNRNDDIGSPQR